MRRGCLAGSIPCLIVLLSCAPKHAGISEDADDMHPACVGLGCKVPRCAGSADTVVSGVVRAPNGVEPIRQAMIYVPQSGRVDPLPAEVGCELCAAPPGGHVALAESAVDGSFRLAGVPSIQGKRTPIVIQKGRFRRVAMVEVTPCAETRLGADEARLPRDRTEGDLPRMAVAVGDFDAIECVLRHIGIAASEFTSPREEGAVHLYDNLQSGSTGPDGAVSIRELVSSLPLMLRYNLLFIGCAEGGNTEALLRDSKIKKNIEDYVARGGRLYSTDWSYDFVAQPQGLSPYICFEDGEPCSVMPRPLGGATRFGGDATPIAAQVGMDLAGGRALSAWLAGLSPGVSGDSVPIVDLAPDWVLMRRTAADMRAFPSTTWLSADVKGARRPLSVSFDYPAGRACGKVLYSSYHTRQRPTRPGVRFPFYCPAGMIAQERVLEFLILEISACVETLG